MFHLSIGALYQIDYFQLFSIPIVLIIIAEIIFLRRSTNPYQYNDAMSSIACGLVTTALTLLIIPLLDLLDWAAKHGMTLALERADHFWSVVIFLGLVLAVDHGYYWGHRFCHIWNLGWASHAVHHQSEHYKLTTAFRNSAFQPYFVAIFQLPLLFIGFPLAWLISANSLVSLYQVWLHTEVIRTLPRWFEYLFNSPSHHRVHHGTNARYLDKNFGGIFIFWDRIYGTFRIEDETAIYGTMKRLDTWHPLTVQVEHFRGVFAWIKQKKSLKQGIAIWFQPPAALDESVETLNDSNRAAPYDTWIDVSSKYCVSVLLILSAIFLGFGITQKSTAAVCITAALLFIIFSKVGRVLDRRQL
ncbi:MAG: sterol desaturase family protein [Chitinophagaceae bacterium]|nr:sterol desaturase family protein [Oligoflexus sp.]